MALDTSQFLLQPSKAQQDLGSTFVSAMQQAMQLKKMREQMEETRRRNKADEELRRQAEAGDMARAAMTANLQRQRLESEQAEKLREDKVAAYSKFAESGGKLDSAAMAAQAPFMRSLGMGVDYLGSAEGQPSYRVTPDAAKDEQAESARLAQTTTFGEGETAVQSLSRLGALGYDTLNTQGGEMAPPEGVESTEDAYGRAREAMQHYRATGEPMRGPDEEDYLGGVPQDVTDLGAAREQVLSQLDPMLRSLVMARPEPFQDSALETARAVRRMNLNPADSAKAFRELQADAETSSTNEAKRQDEVDKVAWEEARAQRDHQWDIEKEGRARTADEQKAYDAHTKEGETMAIDSFKNSEIDKDLAMRNLSTHILGVLKNENKYDEAFVAQTLATLAGTKGPQSDKDLNQILELDLQTTLDQAIAYARRLFIDSAFTPQQREGIISWLEQKNEEATLHANHWVESAERRIDREGAEPTGRRQGWKNFLDSPTIDDDYREEYEEWARARAKGKQPRGAGPIPIGGAPGARAGGPRPIGSEHPEAYYQPGQRMPADTETSEELHAAVRGEPAANARVAANKAIPINQDEEFQTTFRSQFDDAGLNPDYALRIIGGGDYGHAESAGDPTAKAKRSSASGLMQMTRRSAALVGTTPEKLRAMTRAEQVPYMVKYLKLKGIDENSLPEDYALAVAAPAFVGRSKYRDQVVYSKGTESHKINEPWWPPGGGNITIGSILDYYFPDGGDEPEVEDGPVEEAAEEEEGPPPAPTPRNKIDQETLDILR